MTPAQARQVLDLEPGPTAADIDAAFRRHAWDRHPDRGGDAADFALLVEARRVLDRIAGSGPRHWGGAPAAVSVEADAAMRRRAAGDVVRRWTGRRRGRQLE